MAIWFIGIIIPRTCLLCIDEHQDEYEKYFLTVRSFKKTMLYAKEKYNCPYSYHVFQRHLKEHFLAIVEAGVRSNKLVKETIKRDTHIDIQVSGALSNNLQILSKQLTDLTVGEVTKKDRKELRDIISKINDTIANIIRFRKELQLEPTDIGKNIDDKVMYCIKEFPIQYKKQFLERWNSYNES